MKKCVCLLFAALLFLCACTKRYEPSPAPLPGLFETEKPAEAGQPAPEIGGYADFCEALSAKLLSGTKNNNLSPISVYLALAMVTEGADAETKTALLRLLGCKDIGELRSICGAMLEALSIDTESCTLALANAIWMTDRGGAATFREDYLKSLADVFRAEARAVDFTDPETGRQIADWIAARTRGRIRISEDAMKFEPDTIAVLINTIYLNAAWSDAFCPEANETGTFYGIDGETPAEYMHRVEPSSRICRGDGYLRYSIPLVRAGRMTFLLPDEGTSLSELLGSPEKLHALLTGGEEIRAKVDIMLPKFRFQDRFDLKDTLEALGIGLAFSDDADFSGMCDIPAKISKVIQESCVGVDEKGVEAAAYTMVVMNESAMMPEELPQIDFHLTRPFLYAIETYDGMMLFVGTVAEPTVAEP